MPVYLLPEEPVFPPAEEAEPDGLIAVGGDLSVERLIQAYAHGIFPWFKEGGDVYWYSPDPRMVIFPGQFKSPASLNRITRSGKFQVRFDTVFEQVIRRCSDSVRPGEDGTWISHDFIDAYLSLHKMGFAHSVETFYRDELVGGLYGVSLGTAFFGESMFFTMSNASKVALDALVKFCRQNGFKFIDCQVETTHLRQFGATLISRKDYLELLNAALEHHTIKIT
jgi:leucyl/phenylalanyl-tRNA--protein transferase